MNMKQRVRNVVMTWFTDNLEEVKQKIESFALCYDNLVYYIGNLEYTEKEKKHTHILLCFKNAITMGSIHNSFQGIHLEPCIDKKSYIEYLSKEDTKVNRIGGVFATNKQEDDPHLLPHKVDIYSLFMEDLDNGYTKKQLMRKYPSLFIRHFDNIKKLIEEYFCEE